MAKKTSATKTARGSDDSPWERARPRGAKKTLTPTRKTAAKAAAKKAGRPYPNLVDNMREAAKERPAQRQPAKKQPAQKQPAQKQPAKKRSANKRPATRTVKKR
jgi:hypothetical protein